jgi:hypothetical protein
MKGYAYITRNGTDPERGAHLKDPTLDRTPTLGACMTNVRRWVAIGDHVFVISGKVAGVPQYVIGGFEVAEKIDALEAYRRFPQLRLHRMPDGTLDGNVIVAGDGSQHPLDGHGSFERRTQNFLVGRHPIVVASPRQIDIARRETLDTLRRIFNKDGAGVINVIGRCSRMTEAQVRELRNWLLSLHAREMAA